MVFGNYGRQPQRPKRSRARVNFMCDCYLYDCVKEDAKRRGMSAGAWIEGAISNQLQALSDLPDIELELEEKLLEILMHRNARRLQNIGVNPHK